MQSLINLGVFLARSIKSAIFVKVNSNDTAVKIIAAMVSQSFLSEIMKFLSFKNKTS